MNAELQDQVLPGTYVSFVSTGSVHASMSERGVSALGLPLQWGAENELIVIDGEKASEQCPAYLGYPLSSPQMLAVREALRHATTLYLYRTDTGGTAAENALAQAKCTGSRGNALCISVSCEQQTGGREIYTVQTLLEGVAVHTQHVQSPEQLKDNRYVTFLPQEQLAAGVHPLQGGGDGSDSLQGHTAFMQVLESYCPNTVGYAGTNEDIRAAYVDFAKHMREDLGAKCQVVLYRCAADYEGVVSVYNAVQGEEEGALVFWITGVCAGEAVNASSVNRIYDGELTPDAMLSYRECLNAAQAGHMVLHRIADSIRIRNDVNSLVTFTEEKGKMFSSNQTIRVLDQIANDIGILFRDKYLGVCPNDVAGRYSLWTDIVKHHRALCDMRAIEDFEDGDIIVRQGQEPGAVLIYDAITVVNAMTKLYMLCYIA